MPRTINSPKFHLSEYRKFEKTLPEHLQQQYYQFFGLTFSVPRALFVIQKFGLQPEDADQDRIELLAKNFGVSYPQRTSDETAKRSLFDRNLNDDWIETLINTPEITEYPLSHDPIILIEATIGKGKEKRQTWFLTDGGHRLRYHYLTGKPSLKVHMIKEPFARLTRIR
ncbi:hypothetical protein ACQ4M3_13065 [Leptolyngbya sp. AN03gr2]|uniref:hypothetical protein n=1 Tax=unclassified Leptolyngbya TaxID=2650499 RepID=UPI003D31F7B9